MVREIKAIVFDLYGTLIHNSNNTPYLRLFQELCLSPEEMKQAKRIAITEDFEDLSGLVKRIKPNVDIDLQPYQQEVAKCVESANAYPETKKFLEELKKRDLKLGLISNLASPYKKPFFNLELDKYFDLALFSCEIGLRKPDLQIYQKMLYQLECKASHCLMIGDKKHCDVDPPRALRMQAILIDRNVKEGLSIHSLDEVPLYL